jgi:dUTP pyrophosphatase
MRIPIKALDNFPVQKDAFRPTPGNVGVDLYTADDIVLLPGQQQIVCTGIALQVPDLSEFQIRPRSGLARDFRISITNSPGTGDPSYRGEVKVLLENTSPVVLPGHFAMLLEFLRDNVIEGVEQLLDEFYMSLSARTLRLPRGSRFAQLVHASYIIPEYEWVDELETSDRGETGFGNSGVTPLPSIGE